MRERQELQRPHLPLYQQSSAPPLLLTLSLHCPSSLSSHLPSAWPQHLSDRAACPRLQDSTTLSTPLHKVLPLPSPDPVCHDLFLVHLTMPHSYSSLWSLQSRSQEGPASLPGPDLQVFCNATLTPRQMLSTHAEGKRVWDSEFDQPPYR